jgi:hydrogenase expression/formation protein HypC
VCLGIPGRVVELPADRPDFARVDVEGVVRDINVALMDDDPPKSGDWVLIHLGFALQRMTEDEVAEARSTLDVLGEGDALEDDPFANRSFRDDPFAPPGYIGEVSS